MLKKKQILDKLFFCIILNLIPIGLLGMFHIPTKIYTILFGIVYTIQTLILIFYTSQNYEKIPQKMILLWMIIILNCCLTISYDVIKFGTIDHNEIIFSCSVIINILILIIGMNKQEITKEELQLFLKKMTILGIIAAIINLILNYKLMFNLSSLTNSYSANFSSFFPNRNQYGIFMLIMIISLSLLIHLKYEKKYIIYYLIFIANLILSMSRNAILALIIFFGMLIYFKYIKGKKRITKNKAFFYFLGLVILIIAISFCYNNSNVNKLINKLFIRADSLESGSGRFTVWKNGLLIFSKYNPLVGVGRYKAIELNKSLFGSDLEYFHSLYIEKMAEHGIIGLITLLFLFKFVWNKIKFSNIDINMKNILKSAFACFAIISIFETTTRFSIGYADTMALIFFFTFIILVSNLKEN